MTPDTMQAAVARGVRQIEIDTLATPDPAADEIRVRIEACGICGSDLHLFGVGGLAPGLVPGHEMMGTIDAFGPGAAPAGLAIGQRVAVEPFRTCGTCASCRAGRGAICREAKLLGVHANGGLAEYMTAPAARAFAVPEGLPSAVAALAEPLSVSIHGLHRAGFESGQRVLVLGAGAVGLLTVLAARALGAGEVWVSARHPHQAAQAEALGADRILSEAEAEPMALSSLGTTRDIDVVIETVGGTAATLDAAGAAVRPGGAIGVLGLFMAPVQLNTIPLLMKEVTLAWSYCYEHGDARADFADALRILADHADAAGRLVTHELPLAEVARAFEVAADRKAGALKVSIAP
ncbi:MAG: alcohol dehydrogenase catalytic domain-containing protein [Myxococcales bacterium]|nr:alcohol dehydrogenase catalytic domain-containing protein [Myxococcales bacterium]